MNLTRRNLSKLVFAAAAASVTPLAHAIGGPSGPKITLPVRGKLGTFIVNPYGVAPLTAIIFNGGYVLHNVHVRIVPKKDGQEIAYSVSESQVLTHGGIPVFGLYADYVNQVEVKYDRDFNGKTEHIEETYKIYAAPVSLEITGGERSVIPARVVKKPAAGKFADRLYFINNLGLKSGDSQHVVWNNPVGGALEWSNPPLNFIVDTKGEVRWYLKADKIWDRNTIYHSGFMMGWRQNQDGTLTWGYGQRYAKYDIMGREIWNRRLPFGYADFSHSMDPAQNGHYFLRVASTDHRLANGSHVRTVRDIIIEVDQNGVVVDQWRLWEILDPYRDTVLKALDQGAVCLNIDPKAAGKTVSAEEIAKLEKEGKYGDIVGSGAGRNWAHVNSVDYDPSDDSIIISSRHQCACIKIGRDKKVKWILAGTRGWNDSLKSRLLKPVDKNGKPLSCEDNACMNTDFDWTWTQHTAFRIDSKSDRNVIYLSVFDNGDARGFEQPALPSMKYSRAVIYKIDQKKMTVEQIWEYGKERGHEWYSPVTSLTEYMPDKDSVVVYAATAGASYDMKTGGFTSAPNPYLDEFEWGAREPSFEMQLKGTTGYQAFAFDLNKALGQ